MTIRGIITDKVRHNESASCVIRWSGLSIDGFVISKGPVSSSDA